MNTSLTDSNRFCQTGPSFCVKLPTILIVSFENNEIDLASLEVEATFDFFEFDSYKFLFKLIESQVNDIKPEFDKQFDELDIASIAELRSTILQLHIRLVRVLKDTGCYDEEGNLLYRYVNNVSGGFVLRKKDEKPSRKGSA